MSQQSRHLCFLSGTLLTLLVIDNLCKPEDMGNEGRCSFAKVRVRKLASDPSETMGSRRMMNHLLKKMGF